MESSDQNNKFRSVLCNQCDFSGNKDNSENIGTIFVAVLYYTWHTMVDIHVIRQIAHFSEDSIRVAINSVFNDHDDTKKFERRLQVV